MRLFILNILFFSIKGIAWSKDWSGLNQCGIYQVDAVVREIKYTPVIIVNEKTQSEFMINVPILNQPYLVTYFNKPIQALVLFETKSDLQDRQGTVKKISFRIPNPLNPKDTGVKLISKVVCK